MAPTSFHNRNNGGITDYDDTAGGAVVVPAAIHQAPIVFIDLSQDDDDDITTNTNTNNNNNSTSNNNNNNMDVVEILDSPVVERQSLRNLNINLASQHNNNNPSLLSNTQIETSRSASAHLMEPIRASSGNNLHGYHQGHGRRIRHHHHGNTAGILRTEARDSSRSPQNRSVRFSNTTATVSTTDVDRDATAVWRNHSHRQRHRHHEEQVAAPPHDLAQRQTHVNGNISSNRNSNYSINVAAANATRTATIPDQTAVVQIHISSRGFGDRYRMTDMRSREVGPRQRRNHHSDIHEMNAQREQPSTTQHTNRVNNGNVAASPTVTFASSQRYTNNGSTADANPRPMYIDDDFMMYIAIPGRAFRSPSSGSRQQHRSRHNHNRHRTNSRDGLNINDLSYEELLNRFGNGDENLGASIMHISQLPVVPVAVDDVISSDTNTSVGGSSGSNISGSKYCCSVCLENYQVGERKKILPCFHHFHEDCIDQWLHRNGSCPICKHRIGE